MKFIGIKRIWYGAPFDSTMLVENKVTSAKVRAWLNADSTHEVKNSHDGTWGYTQDDPQTNDYINELTGKPYHREMTSEGAKTITWTMGEFEFADLVNLQGGEVLTEGGETAGWQSGDIDLIYMGIVAQTKTGNFICFSNASITGKNDQQDKAIGLGVTAVAMESEVDGIKDEYRFKGSFVEPGVTLNKKTLNLTVGGGDVTLVASVMPSSATVTWTSSATGKATVSNGVVHPVAAGDAVITASISVGGDTFTDTCNVTVASEG